MVDYLSPASGGVGLQGRAAELNEALGVGLSERGGCRIPWDVLEAHTLALVGPDHRRLVSGACNLKLNG